jgi:MFS family permease
MIYASIAIYGYVLYGLGPALDALREELDVSRTQIGLAGSAFAVGAVATALGAPRVLVRVGHGAILRAGLVGFGVGAVLLVAAGSLPVVIAGTFVLGVSGTSLLVVATLVVEARQRPAARAATLAEANVGAPIAGVLAPLAVGAAILLGGSWRAGELLVLAAIAGLVVLVAGTDFGRVPGRHVAARGAAPRLPVPFWRWWCLIVLVVSVEFCMAFWATDFMREEVGVGRGAASAALSLFVAGMAVGRLVGGRLAVVHDPRRLLVGALAVTAIGFALFWGTGWAAVSLVGLAVTGLGVAMLFPLCLSFAMATAPGAAEVASSRASLAGGIAVLIAPYLLGALADGIGVRAGFLIVPALLGAALTLAVRGGGEPGPAATLAP